MKNRVITKNGIIFLTSATFCALLGSTAIATNNSSVDTVSLEVPVSCTLSKTVNTEHQTTMRVGQYEEDIGETSFNVICNDSYGFAIYAVGYSGDQFGNNTMLPTNNNVSNAIATGTATSGDNSNWSMKLTSVTDNFSIENSFNNNHVVSNEYQKVASYQSNTTTSTGAEIKSTYSVYISTAQAADTYVGKVKYTVVHPTSALPQIESISQLTYMQDFTTLSPDQRAIVLDSMAYNTTYNLIDNRDNKTYQVARLKDDNIWMAENLDLGRTALTTNLTSDNTNIDSDTSVSASDFNSWIKTSAAQNYVSAIIIPLSTSNTSNGLDVDPTSNTPYGALYNYCAASAGTLCISNYTDSYSLYDICPAGWRLPTGGTSGEYNTLYNLADYNTYAKMRAPITDGGAAFAATGYFYGYGISYQGSIGQYWSSTMKDNYYAFHLRLNSSSINPNSSSSYRSYGSAIRCVAKKPSHSLTVTYGTGISSIQVNGTTIPNGETVELETGFPYIITMNREAGYYSYWSATSGTIGHADTSTTTYTIGNNDAVLTANASYVTTEIQNLPQSSCTTTASQVRDTRDNHVYTIQKLADNKCWMMENLDLGRTELTTDLTPANTNLSTTIAASTFNSWKKVSGSNSYTDGEFISIDGVDSTTGTPYNTLYNYCAASAGTICAASGENNNNAANDICPAGWRLPTGNTYGEYQTLYSLENYNTAAKMHSSIADGGAAFAYAGQFYTNPYDQNSYGYYWSSTRYDSSKMYYLNSSASSVSPAENGGRYYGYSVRCVAKKPSHTITASYGTGVSNIQVNGVTVLDGGTIELEEGLSYQITMTSSAEYRFTSWSSNYGTFNPADSQTTVYTVGDSNATIVANASYITTAMQGLSSSSCTTTASYAKDNRDGHVYIIQRLADGKCWMMENLDLGRTDLTTDLTSTNTNLSTKITASTFNSWKKTSGSGSYSTGEFIPLSKSNTSDGFDSDSISNTPYGTLYNFCAASAATICTDGYNSNNASRDICPAGWRLPTGGNYSSDYYYLTLEQKPYNIRPSIANGGAAFAYAGYFYDSTPIYQGSRGYYWSSTSYSGGYNMRDLDLSSSGVYVDYSLNRNRGASIRCVLK